MRRYRTPQVGDVVMVQPSARDLYIELRQSATDLRYCNPRIVVDPEERLLVLDTHEFTVRIMTANGAVGWMGHNVLEIVIDITA